MANNKNQHYVQQAYLRNFSSNSRFVSLYVVELRKFVQQASISNQCSKDYYHGFGDELLIIESYLQPLEQAASRVFKNPDLILSDYAKVIDSPDQCGDWEKFLCSILVQLSRTPVLVEENRPFNEMLDELLESSSGGAREKTGMPFFFDHHPSQNLYENLTQYAHICDLVPILAKAPDGSYLVTSDYPVVKTNFAALAGVVKDCAYYLDSAGLVFYYPLSAEVGLFLVDRYIYRFPTHSGVIDLTEGDVETLNLLQVQNCEKAIFTAGGTEDYIEHLVDAASHLRRRGMTVTKGGVPIESKTAEAEGQIIPYTHVNYESPRPAKMLSIFELQDMPKFHRGPFLDQDIRYGCASPAAREYENAIMFEGENLFKFSAFIEKVLRSRGIVRTGDSALRPYEIR